MNWLIFGTGRIVEFANKAINLVDNSASVDYVARNSSSNINNTKFFSDARVFYSENINKAKDGYDIAYIATQGNSHFDYGMKAIKMGIKTIIIEKPIVESLDKLEELLDEAREKGSNVYEGIKTISNPLHKAAKNALRGINGNVSGDVTFTRKSSGKESEKFSKELLKGTYHQHFGYIYSFVNDLCKIRRIENFKYRTNSENDYSFSGRFIVDGGSINFSSDRTKDSNMEFSINKGDSKIVFLNSPWEFAYGRGIIVDGDKMLSQNNSIGLEYEFRDVLNNLKKPDFFKRNNNQSRDILKIYKREYKK